jgi:energy-coupling factor transporter ATP-binding protein EcfA2
VFAILPPRSFLAYDLLRKRVHAVLSSAAALDSSFWNTLLLPITIGVLGTTVGVAPIHCACLERNGSGLLVAGVSGAGKSTLTAALAQLGFPLISDDWTYISRQQCGLVAHGLSSPVKLLPDAARFFPDLKAFAPRMALNGELAYEIDPAGAMGFTAKDTSHPRRIFFLERSSAPGCHMVPCRPEYVRDFFEQNAERLPDELSEAKAFRSSIIQTLSARPSWILRTGESPQTTAKVLDDFLAEADHATA